MSFPDGARGFKNPILGGGGALLRIVEKSKNYTPGVSGWAIFSNGNVEFNSGTFRGNIIVGTTTGKRIEINVTTGVINMFNASNQIVGSWDSNAQTFTIYKDGTGQTAYVQMSTNFASPGIIFQSNTAKYPVAGSVAHSDDALGGGQPDLGIGSGIVAGMNQAILTLLGQSVDGTKIARASLDCGTTATFNRQTGDFLVSGASNWANLTLNAGFQSAATPSNSVAPQGRFLSPNTVQLRGAYQPNPAAGLVSGTKPVNVPAAMIPNALRYSAGGCQLSATTVTVRHKLDTVGAIQVDFTGATPPTWASLDGIIYDLS